MCKNMQRLVELLDYAKGEYCYDADRKTEYKKVSMAVLRKLAKMLCLQKGTFKVSFCRGGAAVWGEAILHSNSVYIQIFTNFSGGESCVLYRTCEGQKDYCGGPNQFLTLDDLNTWGYIALYEAYRRTEANWPEPRPWPAS